MTTTYILRNQVSDLSGGNDFNLTLRQLTTGVLSLTINVAASATEDSYGFTQPGDPSNLGITGAYTVTLNITNGNNQIQLSIGLSRINNTGVVQQTSAFSLEQTASAGVKTFNFPATGLGTWNPGDRLRVTYRFRNTQTMLQTCVIEMNGANSAVVAPWTMPIVGDDAIFTDICGGDLVHIHKWSNVCSQVCSADINATKQNSLSLQFYGLSRYVRGYNNNNKLFYEYHTGEVGSSLCACDPTQPAPCVVVHFGTIDTNSCAHTELVSVQIPWIQNYYRSEFFGVDRNDVMHFLCNYGCPGPGQPIPPGHGYSRYIKVSSTGTILLDVPVDIPPSGSTTGDCCDCGGFNCDPVFYPNGLPITCYANYGIDGSRWLSDDGSKIYGIGSHGTGEIDCHGGTGVCSCSTNSTSVTWTIDTGSGIFSPGGAGVPALTIPNPANTAILGNQILRYRDASVVIFEGISKDGYIVCDHVTNEGVWISRFNLSTGLAATLSTMPGTDPICSVSADLTSDGSTIYLRLDYTSDTDSSLNGRNRLFRTDYPLSASSVFTLVCDLYAVGRTTCHWGQLQVNTATRPLVGGLYVEISDVSTLSATLTAGPPPTAHKRPFVTLIGAN